MDKDPNLVRIDEKISRELIKIQNDMGLDCSINLRREWVSNDENIWTPPTVDEFFLRNPSLRSRLDCNHNLLLVEKIPVRKSMYSLKCTKCGKQKHIHEEKRGVWIKSEDINFDEFNKPILIDDFNDAYSNGFNKVKSFKSRINESIRLVVFLQKSEFKIFYFQSPEWEDKRFDVFSLQERKCGVIGCNCKVYVLHHLHYDNLGNELLEDFIGLCSWHHALIHSKNDWSFIRNRENYTIERLIKKFGTDGLDEKRLLDERDKRVAEKRKAGLPVTLRDYFGDN